MKRSLNALMIGAGLCTPASALAQCPAADWLSSPIQGYPGIRGSVSALTTWDPDGIGPLSPRLVAGGSFTVAGNSIASRIGQWDGTAWQPIGAGLPGTVLALGTYNGSLVAGGILPAPYNGIAIFDGTSWQPLASGIVPSSGSTTVHTLAQFGSDLYIGGAFAGTGADAISGNVARWDGTGWYNVGNGVSGGSATVYAMQVYQNKLVVGGQFSAAAGGSLTVGDLAQWDGAAWSKVGVYGVTTGDYVLALSVFNGELYAGGRFSQVDAVGPMGNGAVFNGTNWAQIGGASVPGGNDIEDFAELGDVLYIGAAFICGWNGSTWATGFSIPTGSTQTNAIESFNGELIFSGSGGKHSIARRSGASWLTLGNGIQPGAGNVTDPRPVVAYSGGVAISSDGFSPTDTNVMTSGVAFWDGANSLTRLGGTEWTTGSRPRAMIVYNNQLIAAGQENGAVGGCVSVLNGSTWQGMGAGSWGGGRVSSLTIFNDELIAGGTFTTASGAAALRVARWTGSSWQQVGNGIGMTFSFGDVRDLAVYNNQLYATGDLSSNGHFARLNGSTWQTVSIGLNQMGFALAPYGNRLYVGGIFTLAGGNPAHGMAYWDGTTLTPDLGGSLATYSLHAAFGNLYAGGLFHFAGNGVADNIAKFDGTDWLPLGNGVGVVSGIGENFPAVRGIASYHNQVIAAGDFLGAGNAVSSSWARYGCPDTGSCFANCDNSTVPPLLNANDFQCFLNAFAAADPYANCDGSTVAPILNANDFQCFLNAYAGGCR